MRRELGWFVLGLGLACSGAEEASGPSEASSAGGEQVQSGLTESAGTEEYPTPPMPWAEMSTEQRGRYMAEAVLPYFRGLFQEYDPERYADFGCATCHGAAMHERAFAMPNPELMPLHPSGTDEQRRMVEEHPRMVRFMFSHVVPAARAAVDGAPYDPETRQGFGCFSCHPSASVSAVPAAAGGAEPAP